METHNESLVWTVASELVAKRGPSAVRRAIDRSRELEQAGDRNGAAVWAEVAETAEKMLRRH